MLCCGCVHELKGRCLPFILFPPVVTCGLPESVTNTKFSATGMTYKSKAVYTCITGYEVSGSMAIVCSDTGKWTKPLGHCSIVECVPLQFPSTLLISTIRRTYGTAVYVNCVTGHTFTGSAAGRSYIRVICMHTGLWSSPLPHCAPINCPSLRSVRYAVKSSLATQYRSIVSYKCSRGFDLIGTASRICLSTKQWSTPEPYCRPVTCSLSLLRHPRNSALSRANSSYLGHAEFVCVPGYSANVRLLEVCQSSRQWSASSDDCTGEI